MCGDDDLSKAVTCGRLECGEEICAECAEAYLTHCATESKVPNCISDKCTGGVYLYSEIKQAIGPVGARHYEEAVYKAMSSKHSGSIAEAREKLVVLERLRDDRKKFVSQSFPKAVMIVAKLVCPDKLNRVEKSQAQKAERTIRNATRICMNLWCNGHMGDDFVCIKCQTAFCPDCEKKKNADHSCRQDDLDSIKTIRNMIQCPNCYLHIERSQGCRNMTCASCKTNFDYYTGEKSTHGAESVKSVTIMEQERLSAVYGDVLNAEALDLLLQIEAMQPAPPSDIRIRKLIESIPDDKIEAAEIYTKTAVRLCVALEKKLRSQYYSQVYYRVISEVEQVCRENKACTVTSLQNLNRAICSAIPSKATQRHKLSKEAEKAKEEQEEKEENEERALKLAIKEKNQTTKQQATLDRAQRACGRKRRRDQEDDQLVNSSEIDLDAIVNTIIDDDDDDDVLMDPSPEVETVVHLQIQIN